MLAGFRSLEAVQPRRLLISVDGLEDTGKTRFGLTGPAPIAVINIDKSLEGTADEFIGKKRIDVRPINYLSPGWNPLAATAPTYNSDETAEQARPEQVRVWRETRSAVMDAIQDPTYRTVILDTGSRAHDAAQCAHFGKEQGVVQRAWGPLNQEWIAIVELAKASEDTNFIVTHRLKDEWRGGSATGGFIRDGSKEIEGAVHVTIRLWKGPKPMDPASAGRGSHERWAEITRCKHNPALIGRVLNMWDDISFKTVAGLVLPDTPADTWEDKPDQLEGA